MTILVAVADSLGFKGSIMAIYLGETKKSVLSFPSLLELKTELQKCFNGWALELKLIRILLLEVAQKENCGTVSGIGRPGVKSYSETCLTIWNSASLFLK